jgi:hypothetical protein
MLQRILWSNQTDTGLEHFFLRRGEKEITADGIVIGVEENVAFRIRYQISCDLKWQVRKVAVTSLDENEQTIRLMSDGFGKMTSWNESIHLAPKVVEAGLAFSACYESCPSN